MFHLITSLFCQNAALAITTLARIYPLHTLYLLVSNCPNILIESHALKAHYQVIHACGPFSASFPPTTITFLTLIFMHTLCKYYLLYLSSSAISFSNLPPAPHHQRTSNL